MASIGTLSIASATDFTTSKTFTGTSAADDYIEFKGSVSPLFTELYVNAQGDLTYTVVAPTINKSGTYIISRANPATAVEGVLRSGVTNDVYNGLSAYAPPGDYSQSTDPYSIYGTTGNDTTLAPLTSTKSTGLQGWEGNDILVGGDVENSFAGGPGNNQMSGKKGADTYRSKTSYLANDIILDDGDDDVADVMQVLLTTKSGWDWSFERVGNDLKGVFSDSVSAYNFLIKDQYIGPYSGIEGFTLYALDNTGVWRGIAFKTANTTGWNNFGEAGSSADDRFTPATAGMGAEKTSYRAWGNGGNDQLTRISDKNFYTFFDGGSGVDTVTYAQARADYTLTKYPSSTGVEGYTVKNNTAASTVTADNMTRVERFIFSDKKLAFDTSGNAGNVAKVLGAVFGKTAVTNKEYVGIGLNLLDSGMSYSGLAAMAISASGARDPDAIVEKLYTNVIGTKPTTAEKAPFVQMLNGGMSSGDLVVLAADTSFNQTNIGLTGLATTGIEYQ